MLIALQGAVSQGVLWGIMVLGVFITFRLLDIPDMTWRRQLCPRRLCLRRAHRQQ